MISVTIQPFGRSLLAMSLASLKYQAANKERINQQLESSYNNLIEQERQTEEFREVSSQMITSLIDKRYKGSKAFLETGAYNNLRFKKTATTEEMKVASIAQIQYLQSRNKYTSAVSNHNRKILDMKMKTSLKKIKI